MIVPLSPRPLLSLQIWSLETLDFLMDSVVSPSCSNLQPWLILYLRKIFIQIFIFFAESFLKNYSGSRLILYKICTHSYWHIGITIVILLNVICMAMEHYNMSTVRFFLACSSYFDLI